MSEGQFLPPAEAGIVFPPRDAVRVTKSQGRIIADLREFFERRPHPWRHHRHMNAEQKRIAARREAKRVARLARIESRNHLSVGRRMVFA